MRHAETVTFGGGGLERRAELRRNSELLSETFQESNHVLLIWRGKPLLGTYGIAWVNAKHSLIALQSEAPVFLGQGLEGEMLFAIDVSAWEPQDADLRTLDQFLDPSEQVPPGAPEGAAFCELRGAMLGLSPLDAEITATARALFTWHASHQFCAKCGQTSAMASGGWQRNCVACQSHNFPRTDPVVIMLITRGNSVLLGRSPHWPERMYSLLAGFVEPGETLEAAVRREVFEESGVRVGEVNYLASQPWPFPASLMFGAHGEAISRDITIDPVEIEAARWVSREELAEVFAGRHPDIDPARKGAIAHFLLENWLADTLD
jgi:NAD+ diphosphatase